MDAAQRGDLAALFTLLRAHRLELWRVCLALALDHARAERLYHDTLVRAAKNLRSVPASSAFLPWLVRLAMHMAVASTRRDGPRASEPAAERADAATHSGSPPGQERTAEHEARAVAAFSAMPESDRLLLALAVHERLPYAEIAAVMRREATEVMHRVSQLRVQIEGARAA